MRRRGLKFWLAVGTAVLVFAGLAAPYFNADRLGNRTRRALEQALGRRVEIGGVRVHLFPAPGISVADVVIHEDPLYGTEPAAYVTTLDARVGLSSLWTHQLEFASLRLAEPSINLVRVVGPGGVTRWNFEPLVARAGAGLPAVMMTDGRVNFKFGRQKSVFYFLNADANLTPPAAGHSEWRMRFAVEPARTDRNARGFGLLEGKGRWRPGGSAELDLRLDGSALADLSTLVHGSDLGIHGLFSLRLHVAGPPSALSLTGTAQIEDVHRWDMMPPHAGVWKLALAGELDAERHVLWLDARPPGTGPPPMLVRIRAADYLSNLRWGAVADLSGFPAGPVVDTARHLGVVVPEGLRAEGTISGAAGYSQPSGFQGRFRVDGGVVRVGSAAQVAFEQPVLVWNGPRLQLLPTVAQMGESRVRMEGDYSPGGNGFQAKIEASPLLLDQMESRALVSDAPLVSGLEGGSCRGHLRYESTPGAPPVWTGRLEVAGASAPVPGLTERVRIESGSLTLEGARVALTGLKARIGPVAWEGDYRYTPGAARPHQFRVSIPELDAADAERLLAPTLTGGRGFLVRTLGIDGSAPDWLAQRRAEGAISIGVLHLGDTKVENVRGHVLWDADTVEFTGLTGRFMDGTLTGSLTVRLRSTGPNYRLVYRIEAADWRNGRFRSEGVLHAAGFGSHLLENAAGEGKFEGRALTAEPDTGIHSLSGEFELGGRARGPWLRFSNLELVLGESHFQGKGASQQGGELVFEFSDGNRQLKLTGTAGGFRLDQAPLDAPRPSEAPPGR